MMREALKVRGYRKDGYRARDLSNLPAVMGTSDMARLLCVSERTVVREASLGHIKGAFKVGSLWRFNTARVLIQYGMVSA